MFGQIRSPQNAAPQGGIYDNVARLKASSSDVLHILEDVYSYTAKVLLLTLTLTSILTLT